jgi:hypothetical protein
VNDYTGVITAWAPLPGGKTGNLTPLLYLQFKLKVLVRLTSIWIAMKFGERAVAFSPLSFFLAIFVTSPLNARILNHYVQKEDFISFFKSFSELAG